MARDVGLLKPMLATNGDLDSRYPNACQTREQLFPSQKDAVRDISHEWKEVAHVLDRLFFWIVFVFMSASALVIMMVPLYKDNFESTGT